LATMTTESRWWPILRYFRWVFLSNGIEVQPVFKGLRIVQERKRVVTCLNPKAARTG
jgi:hypothetical protein